MTEEEYNNRVIALIPKLIPKQTANGPETNELFELYNYRFTPKEYGKGCAGCRQRVYQRMLKHYNEIKGE
jgi:hypothetical protein